MVGLYLGTLIFGSVLIGVSLLFGGDAGDADLEADADMDLDADADMDLDAESELDAGAGSAGEVDTRLRKKGLWLPVFSMRFYTFATFALGLGGLIMTAFGVPTLLTLGISVAMAVVVGWLAALAFRKAYSDTVSGAVSVQQHVGAEARVLLAITSEKRGKVVLKTAAGRLELFAETHDDHTFNPGETVLIAHIDHGIANVTSLNHRQSTTTQEEDAPSPPPRMPQKSG